MYVNRKTHYSFVYFVSRTVYLANNARLQAYSEMPITISVHESNQYVISLFEGKITDAGLVPAFESFYSKDATYASLPELADWSKADFSAVTHQGMTGLATWAEKFLEDHGIKASKTALYNPPGENYKSHCLIYEAWTVGSPENCKTFANREAAIRWLIL